jgi:hypothetical protein
MALRLDFGSARARALAPALTVLLVSALYVLAGWTARGRELRALFDLGSRYAELDPQGSEGYDGQFSYYIALEPAPQAVAPRLDLPAYRYQRILLPMAARLLGLGDPHLIPLALILLPLIAHTAATFGLARLLIQEGLSPWFALSYGLWIGFLPGIARGLHEPLAYGLVVLAFLAWRGQRWALTGLLMSGAILAKETTLTFWAAMVLAALPEGLRSERLRWVGGLPLALFALWQLWLWQTFGQVGLGTGGAGASGWEAIPYMGLLRIIPFSPPYFWLTLVLLTPALLGPGLIGLVHALRRVWKGERHFVHWGLLLNSFILPFIPFSTYREPFAMMRLGAGLVLAVVLYGIHLGSRRLLTYAMFWIALLIMLTGTW